MHYVMSDLHGCYDEYRKALDLIRFGDEDTLIVDGDIFDKGPKPINILIDIMARKNVILLKGNHEAMAIDVLDELTKPGTEAMLKAGSLPKTIQKKFLLWMANEGQITLNQILEFDELSQAKIIQYLMKLPEYQELTVEGQQYIVAHSGLMNFKPERPLSDYSTKELVWDEVDYDSVYFTDKILVTGHTPTDYAFDGNDGRIVRKNNHMAIDCGCVYGHRLGVTCLETGEDFYVESERKRKLMSPVNKKRDVISLPILIQPNSEPTA